MTRPRTLRVAPWSDGWVARLTFNQRDAWQANSGIQDTRDDAMKALRDYLFQQLDHTDDVALIRMATMYLDVQIGREAVPFCVTFEEAA